MIPTPYQAINPMLIMPIRIHSTTLAKARRRRIRLNNRFPPGVLKDQVGSGSILPQTIKGGSAKGFPRFR
jgi:hypothetical protein